MRRKLVLIAGALTPAGPAPVPARPAAAGKLSDATHVGILDRSARRR